ncbi:MAG TPA: hypothetical protein VM366_15580 [Anaerolineae bacterium]|nr:hypothetical protein [Anaerolineae bacterium]
MGCQSEVTIGHYFTFSITTHDPDTGVLTDADAAPIYRIYEDETAVPILTGTMATLDTVNTTGFYTERLQATVAAGFEHGKTYTIYISAVVDADTGGICYGFRAVNTTPTAPATGLVGTTWTVVRGDTLSRTFAAIAADPTITRVQLTVKNVPESEADTAAVLLVDSVTGLVYLNGAAPGVGYTATFSILGVLAVPAFTMAALPVGDYNYDVQIWQAAVVVTIEEGKFVVTADSSRSITPA